MNKCKPGDEILSKPFKMKENFFIRVYPNGSFKAHMGHVGVFVVNLSNKEVMVSKFTISDGVMTKVEEEKVFKENGSDQKNWDCHKWHTYEA